MNFVLFVIYVGTLNLFTTIQVGQFSTMVDCFEARENIVKKMGRPIVNYQVVCINVLDSIQQK